MPDYLPRTVAGLLEWGTNATTRISATPTAFGLVAAQATALSGLFTTFQTAAAAASDPGTRTRASIITRNTARAAFVSMARDLVRVIQAHPGLTDTQRELLQITIPDVTPTPSHAPTEAPVLSVDKVAGRQFTLSLKADGSERRGKPEDVASASIFAFVGEAAPATLTEWVFQGTTTKTQNILLEFPATVPAGSKVWLTAFWSSPRAQSGPACTPIEAYIAGGIAPLMAA